MNWYMDIKKVNVYFLLLACLLVSCKNLNKETSLDDNFEKSIDKARLLLATPESLRSGQEKILIEQIEEAVWEGVTLKNNGNALQFVITVSKEEWKKKGLPMIYYEILQRDITCSNEGLLDTIAFPKQLVLDAFNAKRIEKESQQIENR